MIVNYYFFHVKTPPCHKRFNKFMINESRWQKTVGVPVGIRNAFLPQAGALRWHWAASNIDSQFDIISHPTSLFGKGNATMSVYYLLASQFRIDIWLTNAIQTLYCRNRTKVQISSVRAKLVTQINHAFRCYFRSISCVRRCQWSNECDTPCFKKKTVPFKNLVGELANQLLWYHSSTTASYSSRTTTTVSDNSGERSARKTWFNISLISVVFSTAQEYW